LSQIIGVALNCPPVARAENLKRKGQMGPKRVPQERGTLNTKNTKATYVLPILDNNRMQKL
jgi:hypothetical protein